MQGHCQIILGSHVDKAVGQLIIEAVNSSNFEIAIAVQEEIAKRAKESELQRKHFVERAQYEADLAQMRFMRVDPNNRLVASTLEAEWNDKLRFLEETRQSVEKQCKTEQLEINERLRGKIAKLTADFSCLWNDPATPVKERKRMLAYLIEDVTLLKQEGILAHVRFRGGATRTLKLSNPLNAWQGRTTNSDVLKLVDELLDKHDDKEVAEILNERGIRTGADQAFTTYSINWIRYNHDLKSLKQRLLDRGMVTKDEICKRLSTHKEKLHEWRRAGLITGRTCNAKGEWMFEVPDMTDLPVRKNLEHKISAAQVKAAHSL